MTSTQISAWVPVTSFATGASDHTFGYAPAYRVWPDGKVEWRGVVKIDTSTTREALLTVPTAARPTKDLHFIGATSGISPGSAKLDVCDPLDPTRITVSPPGAVAWVTLDDVSYYKSRGEYY